MLRMTGVSKEFPGVRALSDVDFEVLPGEVHALLGENGAGKSTLIKVLTGVYRADAGEVTLDGQALHITSPTQAREAGISTVYQEVNLCPNLSVAENIFIGSPVRWKKMRGEAKILLRRFGLNLDVQAPLGEYPLAIQQLVAIVRAMRVKARVLILDEPTSSLDRGEVERLFTLMRRLKQEGVAIVFVSHFLDQIYEICDRMTVLRNGTVVGTHPVASLPRGDLVRLMIGKELGALAELTEHIREARGEPLLQAQALGRGSAIAPFDLEIHPGEVTGLAGLLGSGRTEVARLLFGADTPDAGRVLIDGVARSLRTPKAAIANAIAFCPENRRAEGLIPELTVRENILLAVQAARGWSRRVTANGIVERVIGELDIRPSNPDLPARDLSGGNQQKVLLARWLITHPRLLILDEPTRGIDVGAKAEIQKLVVGLSEEGMSVLFISAELDEVLRLSHTIGVLRDRHLVAQVPNTPELKTEITEMIASGAAKS
ncbi:MAG TPA: sugar ABC transporter ATP-binding protein [Candidatus Limnocylindrales bacterium]|nr:sugar ABC transporter ATP-binding protein [Candidatus Limnocylindrales bacterium]